MLARNARDLLNLLDDTPVVPGDEARAFDRSEEAREVLNKAESDLRNWESSWTPVHSNANGLGNSALPQGGSDSIQNTPQQSRVGTGIAEEPVAAHTGTVDEEPLAA